MSIEKRYITVFPEESHVETYAERTATDKVPIESNTTVVSPPVDLTMVETGAIESMAVISRGVR